ncbi:MAG: exodeoxyribonuclease VII large subunit [Holosporales bacterium]|jgi:exodeoxyribonuclease VII large subunit|nr:exodeoxyribonuclease VII large subunit [Holosporales bacterium]
MCPSSVVLDFWDRAADGGAGVDAQPVLSVQELSKNIKKLVEGSFAFVRVRGEVSGLKLHSSGHVYFSLKDSGGDAVLNAVCWRGTAVSPELKDGAEIVVDGRISVYPGRSNYQIVVLKVEPVGEGSLLKLLMERKEKLAKEGLFDQKRGLPKYPRTLGVITSPTGAVIQDILHRVSERYPCRVVLWPVLVQGNGAAEQISAAVAGLNGLAAPDRPDVLIVARGGGSIEDLWPFNEEIVVRAVFSSSIPVISAIGHETDVTLVDYAADVRAPTPTAAAEIATPVYQQVFADICEKRELRGRALRRIVEVLQLSLKIHKIPSPAQWIDNKIIRIDDLLERFHRALLQTISRYENYIAYASKNLKSPQNIISVASVKLPLVASNFHALFRQKTQIFHDTLFLLQERLRRSSYQSVLERGFCFVTNADGIAVTSAYDAAIVGGESIDIHFTDGRIAVRPS